VWLINNALKHFELLPANWLAIKLNLTLVSNLVSFILLVFPMKTYSITLVRRRKEALSDDFG